MGHCPICNSTCSIHHDDHGLIMRVNCNNCNNYAFIDSLWKVHNYSLNYLELDESDRTKLIYYMHNIKSKSEILELNIKKIKQIISVVELPPIDEQMDILLRIIGNKNNMPGKRIKFILSDYIFKIGSSDIHTTRWILSQLIEENLIKKLSDKSNTNEIEVILTKKGLLKYEELNNIIKTPIIMISNYLKDFLTKGDLQQKYPKAFNKWAEADKLLWMKKEDENTTIGHKCRECLQEFASELIIKLEIENADDDIKHVKNRLKSVLNECNIGKTLPKFIERFYSYIDIINDLVQKQEHGASKENVNLTWNDSRRVVFHTALIMLEVDSLIT